MHIIRYRECYIISKTRYKAIFCPGGEDKHILYLEKVYLFVSTSAFDRRLRNCVTTRETTYTSHKHIIQML